MKIIEVLLVLALGIVFVESGNYGCKYNFGICDEDCPAGTTVFISDCETPGKTERTCDNPIATELPAICDHTRCDCNEPTVRDKISGKCVNLEDCPKKAQ